MPSTICFTSDNERNELCRCVRVLMLDACDRERCARGRHVGVGMRCAEPELFGLLFGAYALSVLRWRRRRMPASFLLLACKSARGTRTKATDTAAPAGRQAHWPQRGLAGPSPFGSGSLVVWLCIHSTAPAPRCCRCGGWTGQGTLCLRLPAARPCPAPLTDPRCTHGLRCAA